MVLVTVKQGQLKGIRKKSVLCDKEYYSFLGVPYATPPLGLLRFQSPKPATNWSGIRDATKEKDVCLQLDLLVTNKIIGSEDCLYLNVHVPQDPSKITSLKPVVIFIHGGAYTFGSGSITAYSPDYLIEHDVIFVSFNYRLHVFGFLGLGLPDCPGNVGLKDQLLALEWVHDNIRSFGGDPQNVTLMGQSCGASCVHLHLLTPLAKGKRLFQKGIISSGTALSLWSTADEPLKTANDLGGILGYGGKDKKKLLKFLKSMPANKLVEAVVRLRTEFIRDHPKSMLQFSFRPCVEEIKENAFLPEHPLKLLKHGETVPLIAGFNDMEGMIGFDADSMSKMITSFEIDRNHIVLENLPIKDESDADEIIDKICEFYSLHAPDLNDSLPFVQLVSDWITIKDYNRSLSPTLEAGHTIYQYIFVYEGERNIHKMTVAPMMPNKIKGASHGDELGYLFPVTWLPQDKYTDDDLNVIRIMTSLWTNFAKTGNPNSDDINIKWDPLIKGQNKTYLRIDKNMEIIHDDLILEIRLQFWDEILNRYVYKELSTK